MQKKKLAIIGTTGLPAKYGGFETLAHHLTAQLASQYEMTVYCSSRYFAKKKDRPSSHNGAKLVYLPFNANGYQSILYDIFSLLHAIRKSDVLLVLGISGTILFPFLRLFSKKPILVNIDGQEWKRAKWNWVARKFLSLSEKIAVRYANTVIADNRLILEYVRDGYKRNDCRLIEYGGDHVQPVQATLHDFQKFPFLKNDYAIKVCRVEPENNVHLILEAFSKVPDQTLVLIGLWDHNSYGRRLRSQYQKFSNLHLLDPIYDQQGIDMLRSHASYYVHGHSAGGTNPSLVEAMSLGLPILAYDVSYNRETTAYSAAYFSTSKELEELLNSLNIDHLRGQGREMKQYAENRYTWKRISSLYRDAIENKNLSETVEKLHIKLANQPVSPYLVPCLNPES